MTLDRNNLMKVCENPKYQVKSDQNYSDCVGLSSWKYMCENLKISGTHRVDQEFFFGSGFEMKFRDKLHGIELKIFTNIVSNTP